MKKFCFLALFAALAAEGFAEEGAHTISIGTRAGLLSGRAEEIVFADEVSSNKMSQLLWEMKSLAYAGIDLRYVWQKPAARWGFFADAEVRFGLSGSSGKLEDRDWIVSEYPDFLTHYSVHDARTEEARLMDFDAGFSFRIFEKFLVKPFLSYSYMAFSWSALGGSFLYPEWEGGHGYLLEDIRVGTYTQTWKIISAGVSFYGAFNRYFDAEVSLRLSPLIWCEAVDNHILRDLTVTEPALRAGLFAEPSLLFSFTPHDDYFKLSLSLAYRHISGTRGDSEYSVEGEAVEGVPRNTGGAGFSALDIGLVARFSPWNF